MTVEVRLMKQLKIGRFTNLLLRMWSHLRNATAKMIMHPALRLGGLKVLWLFGDASPCRISGEGVERKRGLRHQLLSALAPPEPLSRASGDPRPHLLDITRHRKPKNIPMRRGSRIVLSGGDHGDHPASLQK